MCEKPLLKASHIKNNEYNFDKVFEVMKPTFEKSDYVIGNLETISAGNELGYTNHIYSFNTPKQFIRSIKDSGIDMVTTATNHSLDRGIKGLKENLLTLEKYNLEDRKSTRLNSSHVAISYAVFCLKKKKKKPKTIDDMTTTTST